MTHAIFDLTVLNIDAEETPLSIYQGKVLLIVNVASQCGFTGQYAELEKLYQVYKDKGLEILAFPCNQFAHQEPGNDSEIKRFCQTQYQVTFPLFSKIEVNGDNAAPLFHFLKSQQAGLLKSKKIKWNFTKFLVDKKGAVVKRYAPATKPRQIIADLEKLLS